MTAQELVENLGAGLVGCHVWTVPMGSWPGGVCRVIEVAPDAGAPEIVFRVSHAEHGDIGVFDFEAVRLVEGGRG